MSNDVVAELTLEADAVTSCEPPYLAKLLRRARDEIIALREKVFIFAASNEEWLKDKAVAEGQSMSGVRALCRERYGDTPCIAIKSGRGTLTETYDCKDWCPLLRRSIEDPCHQTTMPIQRTLSP